MLAMYRLQGQRHAMLPKYGAVPVASRHMLDELMRNGVNPARAHHVPLMAGDAPVDPEPPTPRDFSNTLLFVGRLTELKGVEMAIRALPATARALGRPLKLRVLGDGGDASRLTLLARKLDALVELSGHATPDERNDRMREADLLVVPSVWNEPFGLVGIEGGAVGLPAVAFDLGGIREWLVPGRSGELAEVPPTPLNLADAMVRALARKDHWQTLRSGAWEKARTFQLQEHLAKLEVVLAQVKAT
jgi:glycosyltransferase involved in cell wall biosynthesis